MMNISAKITRIPTIRGSTKKEFFELIVGSSTNKRISEEPHMFQCVFTYTGHRPLLLVVNNDETFPGSAKHRNDLTVWDRTCTGRC